jgi:hypothetical protein
MNMRRTVVVAVAALALVATGAAGAVRTGVLRIDVGSVSSRASGVTVHGKWTLVVHDRGGRVVARRRFENSLTTEGGQALVDLLLGGTYGVFEGSGGSGSTPPVGVIGGQAVQLDDGTAPLSGKGCNTVPFTNPCFVWHTNGDASDLTQPPVGSGPLHVGVGASSVTLSGSAATIVPTTIGKVETMLKVCGSHEVSALHSDEEYDPNACANETSKDASWIPFTSKTLSSPLAIAAGQSISFTVQLSFS